MDIEIPPETQPDDPMNGSNQAIQLCDRIDGAICYIILLGVILFSLRIYIREIYTLGKRHTLRTFILLSSLLNSSMLLLYTFMARAFHDEWTAVEEAIGDLVTSTFAFMQFYFVILWYLRASCAAATCDDGEDELPTFEELPILRGRTSLWIFVCGWLVPYLCVGVWMIVSGYLDLFANYQSGVLLFTSCVFLVGGLAVIAKVITRTNVLNIAAESYSVIKRTRVAVYALAGCCLFAIALSAVSLFAPDSVSDYVNVMDTKYYTCYRLPCLVNFLARIIVLVCVPNVTISFIFSSPAEPELFLVPVNRLSSRTSTDGRPSIRYSRLNRR